MLPPAHIRRSVGASALWLVAIGTSPSAGGCRAPISEIISHCADYQIKRGSVDLAERVAHPTARRKKLNT